MPRKVTKVAVYKDGVLVKVFNGLKPAAQFIGTYASRISYAILRHEVLQGYTFEIYEDKLCFIDWLQSCKLQSCNKGK